MTQIDAKFSIPVNPGVYILCMRAPRSRDIVIGKRGTLHADENAIYLYIGSALNGLRSRLGRHLARSGKNIHWHVDHLLQVLEIFRICYAITDERKECAISIEINQQSNIFKAIDGIGNSDCRSCPSHLYRYLETGTPETLDAGLRAAFDHAGLQPIIRAIDSGPQTNEPRMHPSME